MADQLRSDSPTLPHVVSKILTLIETHHYTAAMKRSTVILR